MNTIRSFMRADWPAIWDILVPVFRAGDTYSFAADISESEALRAWIEVPTTTFVVESQSGQILGTYYIKPNQPGQGSHVCNCGYIVDTAARGQGIATLIRGGHLTWF